MYSFRKFLHRGNLIQLAAAFIIAAAFNELVLAFTKSFITPLLGIFGNEPRFSDQSFKIGSSEFLYGLFVDALISFIITALVLYYLIVTPSEWLLTIFGGEREMSQCPECISIISKKARRCPYCTSTTEFGNEKGKMLDKNTKSQPQESVPPIKIDLDLDESFH